MTFFTETDNTTQHNRYPMHWLLSIAVITPCPEVIYGGKVYFGLWFQRAGVHHGGRHDGSQ